MILNDWLDDNKELFSFSVMTFNFISRNLVVCYYNSSLKFIIWMFALYYTPVFWSSHSLLKSSFPMQVTIVHRSLHILHVCVKNMLSFKRKLGRRYSFYVIICCMCLCVNVLALSNAGSNWNFQPFILCFLFFILHSSVNISHVFSKWYLWDHIDVLATASLLMPCN